MTTKEAEFKRLLFRAGFACGNSGVSVAEIKEREWEKFLHADAWEQRQILFYLRETIRRQYGNRRTV